MNKTQKQIICLLFITTILLSCRTKKSFNGTATLDCPSIENPKSTEKESSGSKYQLILLKDGKKVGPKTKRGKSRLFKNK